MTCRGIHRLGTAALTVLGASGMARAAFTPLPLTSGSYNVDVVVERSAATFSGAVTATMDGGIGSTTGFTWMEAGLDSANPTSGLPQGAGTYTVPSGTTPGASAGDQYVFAPYTGNNVVMVNGSNKTATLTLSSPVAANSALSFLTSTGSGSGTVTFSINFSDGTASATGLVFGSPDWFNNSPTAYAADGRVQSGSPFSFDSESSGNHSPGDGGNPRLYAETVFVPPADQGHPISGISITNFSGSGNTAIFAVSTGVPEPASLGLAALGGLGLLARRRRP